MVWERLIEGNSLVTAPWLGGHFLLFGTRKWRIGQTPPSSGWHEFTCSGRRADWVKSVPPLPDQLSYIVCGYLAGDRLVPDSVELALEPAQVASRCERVFLLDQLDRFTRISAGRISVQAPLVFRQQEMPLGPEPKVLQAFLEQQPTTKNVSGVIPALDAAFRIESWQRVEAARRRAEIELERKRQEINRSLGDGYSRRQIASRDFETACRAALTVGGAQYLDHRNSAHDREVVVTFRLNGEMFQCTCDRNTLRIVDAGICLTDEDTGEKGDTRFTLESLPAVIRQAIVENRLVVYRHVR